MESWCKNKNEINIFCRKKRKLTKNQKHSKLNIYSVCKGNFIQRKRVSFRSKLFNFAVMRHVFASPPSRTTARDDIHHLTDAMQTRHFVTYTYIRLARFEPAPVIITTLPERTKTNEPVRACAFENIKYPSNLC